MACIIFGAGSYYGLEYCPQPGDYIIAADGGWQYCKQEGIVPDLLLGDFDSLAVVPDFAHIHRVPVEKDDSDMMPCRFAGKVMLSLRITVYRSLSPYSQPRAP